MRRYIDADRVTEAFVKAAKQVGNIGDQIAFRMMINEIPAADVRENVHGAWEYREAESDRWDEIKCPFCKKCYTVDAYRIDDIGFTATDFKFCPNCGAEMRPITALSKNAEIDSNSKRGES